MLLSRRTDQSLQHRLWAQPNPCPSCGRTMQLSRNTPGGGTLTETRSCGCAECGLWIFDAPPLADVAVPNSASAAKVLPRRIVR